MLPHLIISILLIKLQGESINQIVHITLIIQVGYPSRYHYHQHLDDEVGILTDLEIGIGREFSELLPEVVFIKGVLHGGGVDEGGFGGLGGRGVLGAPEEVLVPDVDEYSILG